MPVRKTMIRSLAAGIAAVGAAVGATVFGAADASAGTSTLFTITAVAPHHVADGLAGQVITVTGTGFDESLINKVSISGCTTDPTYIVQSDTTLLLKTAGTDCAKSTATSETVTITDTSSNTYVDTPGTNTKEQLVFVDPPAIATQSASLHPVVADNSATVAYANQVASGSTSGGTVVRVTAATGTAFVNNSTYPLSALLDGVAMTSVTMHTGGDYFTGVLGAHAADSAPVLKITSNGVTRTFTSGTGANHHDFVLAGNTISVSPASGAINGGTKLVVTGAGFTSGTTVTVGGSSCPVVAGTQTATKLTCTVPAATTAAPVEVVATTSGVSNIVSPSSTFTYLSQ